MADSGNPIKIGGKAVAHGANPTAVAAGDVVDGLMNRAGVPFIVGGHPNSITREVLVTSVDGARLNDDLATVGSGAKIVVTRLSVTMDHANTVDVTIGIGFGASAVPTSTLAGTDGLLMVHDALQPGSGVIQGDGSSILGVGADGEDLRFSNSPPTGGSMRLLATYYTVES